MFLLTINLKLIEHQEAILQTTVRLSKTEKNDKKEILVDWLIIFKKYTHWIES